MDEISTNYQRCTVTVMDTEGTDISFDEQGICNNVHEFKRDLQLYPQCDKDRNIQLTEIVDEIKKSGRGKQYDCIVGVSGGVDSTYVAYQAVKLGLRPLAVHVDNGWNSELAVNNIENMINTLGIDLYTHVIDWPEFKDLQLSFLKASVSDAEIPSDHANRSVLMQVAIKEKIKYSLTGRNLSGEGILGDNWTYTTLDWKYVKAVQKQFGKRKLKKYPHSSVFKILKSTVLNRVRDILILNYLPYKKESALSEIKKDLGYREYEQKHYESIYTRFFQSYILPKKFNIDKRKAHFSVLILNGQMTREDALEQLKTPPISEQKLQIDKEFVLKKLGLTECEFEQIMNKPIKKYTDYPNNKFYFKFHENKKTLMVVRLLKRAKILPQEFAARSAPC